MVGIRARVTPFPGFCRILFSLRLSLYLPSCQSIQWRHIGRPTRPARRQTGPLVLFGDVLQEELNRTCQLPIGALRIAYDKNLLRSDGSRPHCLSAIAPLLTDVKASRAPEMKCSSEILTLYRYSGGKCPAYPPATAGGTDSTRSRSEPAPVLGRDEKRLDHFGGDVVAVELVEFIQPEVEAGEVQVGGGVGVSSEIAEVLQ